MGLRSISSKAVFPFLLFGMILGDSSRGFSSETAEVVAFSPQGVVKQVRQVTATFSEPMTPLGDPRDSLKPFEISCAEKGAARWADPKNWVYDFDRDLPAGVQCEFKLRSGLKSLAGQELVGKRSFSFSTGGLSIESSVPYEGSSIHEDQAFVLRLNGKGNESWLLEHVHFWVEGIQERIPVQLIQGAQRMKILETLGEKNPDVWVVQAKRIFPYGAQVTLAFGEGDPQKLRFEVRKEFSAKFSCSRETADSGCIPLSSMHLSFTSPISSSDAKKISLRSREGAVWHPKLDTSESEDSDQTLQSVRFEGPFPEQTTFKLQIPTGLKDESGRSLSNQNTFPLEITTDQLPPLAKFSALFGILEATREGGVLPVTVRNLETDGRIRGKILKVNGSSKVASIVDWLAKVNHQSEGIQRGQSILTNPAIAGSSFTLPKSNGSQAFEVMGIPLKKPGFYVVELESKTLGNKLLGLDKSMYVSTVALVTKLGVHFKKGRESSLAWVTSLDSAKPVPGADVEVRDCYGTLIAQGRTDKFGLLKLGTLPEKTAECSREGVYSPYLSGIFVTASKEGDFSFTHSSWNHGIEYWRFNLPREYSPGPNIVHTVFDRSLLRAGETIHMKHYLRRHGMEGFVPVPRDQFPGSVQIQHSGSDQKYHLPIQWNSNDTAESQWVIPKEAKLGVYEVALLTKKGSPKEPTEDTWTSGRFRVEEFRIPLMKGSIRPPSDSLISPTQITVDVSAEYLAGGGAGLLPVQFRYQQAAHEIQNFPDFEGFTFSNGSVHQERERETNEADSDASGEGEAFKLQKQTITLDKTGASRITLSGLKKMEATSRLTLELEFRDPNGEVQTHSSSVPIFPARRLVGIKSESWAGSRKSVKFHAAVVDLKGKPVAGAPVEVDFLQRKHYSHRKKLIGGFYAYENRSELKFLGKACQGVTDPKGLFSCDVAPPAGGNLFLQAKAPDEKGNLSFANTSVYVYDSERAWFAQGDDDRIDLLPEKKRYEPGEIARFQVQMPFDHATVLVTVEREGILDSFVMPVSGQKPVVEIPIKENYTPNVFVSVLALRGRVGEVQPTAMVDLGKPSFKLGISELHVGWQEHELKVKVSPEKDVYQVREKAKVKIHVSSATGGKLSAGSEVAVAVVDEGLLQLSPNESWKLLEAVMNRRGYEVDTYTAQMEIIGKRHFGLKAVPHGGGGGNTPTRELFDTLLFWKANIPVDENGDITLQIPLNDSITSFRISAIASAGRDQFGTGSASIRSTQDLMILSGLPPLVRDGDHFPASFTLRNSTQEPMELEVSGEVIGLGGSLASQKLTLPPGESRIVSWPIQVPSGLETLTYEVRARAIGDFQARDRLKISQKVIPAVPVRTFQATLTQVDNEARIEVEQPQDALKGKGGIRVSLQPSLLASLTGVVDYMKAYPYGCLEQQTSKAIATGDRDHWNRIMRELPSYLDSEGLAKYFPSTLLDGSDSLTAYLLSIGKEAGWEIPEGERQRMISGLEKFIQGGITRGSSLRTTDLAIRKLAALEALSRTGNVKAAMLSVFDLTPNLWPTSAVMDWLNILHRVQDIPEREVKLREAEEILRARLNFQGTRMGFSTEKRDRYDWLMISNDVNANRLVLSLLDSMTWPDLKESLPRIVRGAVQRQHRGHWDTTTANAWGVLALEKFAKKYESAAVTGATNVSLNASDKEVNWNVNPDGASFHFPWPKRKKELKLNQSGDGKPWAIVQSFAAIPLKEALSSGFRIRKSYVPVDQKKPGEWSRGDTVRVHLELEAQADSTWVVMNDPIPAGSSILGTGLGNDSSLSTQKEKREGWVWPVFEERSFDSFRSYFEFVPKGRWTVEYTVRLNQAGVLNLPASRLEALYSPEVFGEIPNASFQIGE